MATRARPSISKRRKEEARKQRQREKAERRAQREAERQERGKTPAGEDPDIAGIVPGPQPPPWELADAEPLDDDDSDTPKARSKVQ